MKKTFFSLIFAVFFFSISSFAQQKEGNMSFPVKEHNFQKIKEADGPASYKFEFTNTGSMPVIITNVQASCGCTTPKWSEAPIPPGGKGEINVQYDPRNRPGTFNKSISVTAKVTETKMQTVELKIMGEVLQKEKSVEEEYPFTLGELRMKNTRIAFAKVAPTETKTKTTEVINNGKNPIKVAFKNVPQHLTISIKPAVLRPKEKGTIEVTFDAKKRNDWDIVEDPVQVTIDGNEKGNVIVLATIRETFSKEQMKNSPKMEFDGKVMSFDFGNIKHGQKVEHEFKFKNTGKSTLKIYKSQTSCGCTIGEMKKREFEPEEASSVKVIFDSTGKSGVINQTVTLITNITDDSAYRIILIIKGTIVQ